MIIFACDIIQNMFYVALESCTNIIFLRFCNEPFDFYVLRTLIRSAFTICTQKKINIAFADKAAITAIVIYYDFYKSSAFILFSV